MQFAKSTAAVQWTWVTLHLYGEQMSIGVFAVKHGCCQPVLQTGTEQWVMQFAKSSAAVQIDLWTLALHKAVQSPNTSAL